MTDLFRPTAAYGQETKPFAGRVTSPALDYAQRHGARQNTDDLEEEDDGQINCICGFNEDDGNTVACDTCNKWQHIICYYPQYGDSLPEDLDPDSDEVSEASDAETPASEGWQRYGIESYVCLRLIHAAKQSIKTGAAIAFC